MKNQTMLCNGRYVANDPCYPLCSLPDGSGCDYSSIFGGGGIGGPTQQYSVTTGNAVAGNTSTRVNTTMIDPYQNIIPSMLNASGNSRVSNNQWSNDGTTNQVFVGFDGGNDKSDFMFGDY